MPRPTSAGVGTSEHQPLQQTFGDLVTVLPGHPDNVDVWSSLERFRERMPVDVDSGHDGCLRIEQGSHGFPERGRGQLHLPQLVDDYRFVCPRLPQLGQDEAFEARDIHAVPPDSRRTRQIDVGQDATLPFRALPGHALYSEPDAAPLLPHLLSCKPSQREAVCAKLFH